MLKEFKLYSDGTYSVMRIGDTLDTSFDANTESGLIDIATGRRLFDESNASTQFQFIHSESGAVANLSRDTFAKRLILLMH